MRIPARFYFIKSLLLLFPFFPISAIPNFGGLKNNFFVGISNKSLLFVSDNFTTYALERSTKENRPSFFWQHTY